MEDGSAVPNKRNIKDLYPLAPMQEGMLLQSLFSTQAGMYFEHLLWTFQGPLEAALLKKSWEHAIARHAVLRTAFVWEGLEKPLQAVRRSVAAPWREEDWRSLSAQKQQESLDSFVERDRREGFDLAKAPLMRLALIRLADNRWRFVWAYHHILLDGWSVELVLEDVWACYAAFSQGDQPRLRPRRPYRRYIAWLKAQDSEKAEQYWRSILQGLDPAPLIPLPPPAQSLPGGEKELRAEMTVDDSEALKELARSARTTLNTVLTGSWALLLQRLNGCRDVLFGTVASGRPAELPGADSMVGLFINTLPLRLRVEARQTLLPWLQSLQSRLVEMRRYEYTPLSKIQSWTGPASGAPLFETLFVFENLPAGQGVRNRLQQVQVRDRTHLETLSGYPLSLIVEPRQRLVLILAYDQQRFEADAARRLLGNLSRLLQSMARRPDKPLEELAWLQPDERRQLLQWGQAGPAAPETALHHAFEAQAAAAPDSAAAVQGDAHLSYAELNRRANRLARRVRCGHAAPERPLACCLPRSPELLTAFLGILKSGSACLPLDPAAPRQRLQTMLQNSSAGLLLIRQEGDPLPADLPIFRMDADWGAAQAESPANLEAPTDPEQTAFILYTSGSTGEPKGVVLTHRAAAGHAAEMARLASLRPGDRLLLHYSPAFDAALDQIFPALAAGCCLVQRGEELWLPAEFPGLAARLGLCLADLPAAYWHQMVEHLSTRPDAFAGTPLRSLQVGGEELLPSAVQAWLQLEAAPLLRNIYGPAEAVIGATVGEIRTPPPAGRRVSIGRPLAGRSAWILDRRLGLRPIGIPGEICLGGALLARGYLSRPAQTARSFVPDPFSPLPGARLYRSGDLARLHPDGQIEFLGRIDSQLKIRGYRVEPAEVEAALLQHPEVLQAAVKPVEAAGGGKRLAAYFVQKTECGGQGTAEAEEIGEALRQYLGKCLPEYMIPYSFTALAALPLTSSGKIDRRALPDQPAAQHGRPASLAPRNPLEAKLAGIWSQVLGLEQVSVEDDFFRLGGHSLLATQVVYRLQRDLGIELPLRALFEAPTIAALALRVHSSRAKTPAPPIQPAERRSGLPLSFAQQRLWFLDRMVPNHSFYNIPAAWTMEGSLDVSALRSSLSAAVHRHEVLRTSFPQREGVPVQHISPPGPFPLPLVDLDALPEPLRSLEARRLAEREAAMPFNLSQGPLIRATLVLLGGEPKVQGSRSKVQGPGSKVQSGSAASSRRPPASSLLLLTLHHIVADGWSVDLLLNELTEGYRSRFAVAEAEGDPGTGSGTGRGTVSGLATDNLQLTTSTLPIQYADFAVWQRRRLQGELLQQQLAFWQEQLAGAATLQLPADRPRPVLQTFRGGQHFFNVSKRLLQDLLKLCLSNGATLYMTLLAVFQTLLFRLSGQGDIVVGSPIANRNHPDIEKLIGFFANTLVMRSRLSGQMTFKDLLKQAAQNALDAYDHQDLPFEKLVELLHPDRDLSRNPLFQVMLVLQNTPHAQVELPGLKIRPLAFDVHTSHFDLELHFRETSEGLRGGLFYDRDLFDRTTILRLQRRLLVLLEAAAAHPECSLADLPCCDGAEMHQLLREWNEVAASEVHLQCLHRFFEDSARKAPDVIAAGGPDDFTRPAALLSYGELDRRGDGLALQLQAMGAAPDVPVALSLPRSTEMLIGLVGILKSGAAVLPLDPAYPDERCRFMLDDAQALLNLTFGGKSTPANGSADRSLSLRDWWESAPVKLPQRPFSRTGLDHLVYLIYTSGSTGRPKGVAMPHRTVANLICWMCRMPAFRHPMRTLQFTTLSFDASFQEIFSTWRAGGTLVLISQEQRRDPAALLRLMGRHQVEHLFLPFAALQQLAESARSSARFPRQLMQVTTAGEQLRSIPALREFFAGLPQCRLHNHYGPSETHVATGFRLPRDPQSWTELPSIGYCVADVPVHVLDSSLNPAPCSAAGELHIGGEGVARGYLGRPAQTARRFIPDPFSRRPGCRLYRSGDLARRMADGKLEFLGRMDRQVKIRGFRIEPGEVEAALSNHPQVAEAAVGVWPDPQGNPSLTAYLQPKDGAAPLLDALRRFLSGQLPEYMLPSSLVVLDAFPQTPSGKLDRSALPPPGSGRPQLEAAYVSPRNRIERRLEEIWKAVLQVEQAGVRDNFFDLGGHSLLLTQLQSRLAGEFGCEIPIVELFRRPSIETQAALFSDEEPERKPSGRVSERARKQRQAAIQARLRQRVRGHVGN